MQFDRVINAQVRLRDPESFNYRGLLSIDNLRMTFSIYKSRSSSTNTCNFKVYNLSADKRNRLALYGDQLRVSAGYRNANGPQVLFIGDTTQVSHLFAEPEIITSLDCADGDKAVNNVIISLSYAGETSARSVVEDIAQRMQLNIVRFAPTENYTYTHGFSFAGLAIDALKKVCEYLNLIPTVQNGDLYILDYNLGNLKPPFDINADTGMIGTPERFTDKNQYLYKPLPKNGRAEPGWKVKTLLRPEILPGDRIRLRSQRADVNAVFQVLSARHEGDNWGLQFESTFEVSSI